MVGITAFVMLSLLLCTAAWYDVRTAKVPNWLTYGGAVAGLAFWTIAGATGASSNIPTAGVGFGESFAALLTGLMPVLVFYLLGGFGGGDVKLAGAAGAMCGTWRCALSMLFGGLVVVMLMAIIVMVRRRLVRRTASRLFGAALTLAARARPEFPDDGPRIPVAMALAVGGIVAGVEFLLGVRVPWSV